MTTFTHDAQVPIELAVNGQRFALAVEPRRSLADVIRRDLSLTGTRVGCDEGVCGSCTVLMNGEPVRACVVLAVQGDQAEIETVESLAPTGELSLLQRAFTDRHALQCGFCTPGFLMLATALLRRKDSPSRQEVLQAMGANLCRCTGYTGIIDAVESVVGREGRGSWA